MMETALLTAIINRGGDEVLARLSEDDFENLNNKLVFKTVREMWLKGEAISPVTVKAENQNIAISDILKMDDVVLSTKDEINKMAESIKNQSAIRQIKKLLNETNTLLKEEDAKTIKTRLYEVLNTIDVDISERRVKDLKTVILEATDWIENQYNKAKENGIMTTGIKDLDFYTGGLFDGEMTVIAARPSVGKTALGLHIALKLAKEGKKVHFVSREMSHNALGMRIISMASGISTGKIKSGQLTEEDWVKMGKAMRYCENTNLKIDTKSKTPSDIKAVTQELKAQEGLDLVVIDYLQILTPDGKHGSREQEVASISRSLKNLSLDLNRPVIVLAQLNRNAENKRPTLADMRESGAIEADADNVWFLHSPTEGQVEGEKLQKYRACINNGFRYLEIIVGKHRNGPTGAVEVVFDPAKMRFMGFTKKEE